jgi:hypothetical protein
MPATLITDVDKRKLAETIFLPYLIQKVDISQVNNDFSYFDDTKRFWNTIDP